jgi:hypothetical protein
MATQPLQVNGVFQVEILVDVGSGTLVPLPDLVHERSELTLAVNKAAKHIHTFSTANLAVVDKLLKTTLLQFTPTVAIKIGVAQGGLPFWFPTQRHILLYTDVVPTGSGHILTLVTSDISYTLARKSKTRFHVGTISSIVEKIATENGLSTVIEPTAGNWSFIQSNQTDGEFMMRLVARAINRAGHGPFYLFGQDNALHFHTLAYSVAVKGLNVFSVSGSKVVLSTKIQDTIPEGGAGTTVVGVDLSSGNSYAISSAKDGIIRYGNQAPDLTSLGPNVVDVHPSWNRTEELKALAQVRYAASHQSQMTCTVTLDSAYPVVVNDLIQLAINSSATIQSPWSGLYSVVGAVHTIVKGAMSSTISLQRGEFDTPALPPTVSDAIPLDASRAPGQPIVINTLTHSNVTQGPAGTFTAGSFVKEIIPA